MKIAYSYRRWSSEPQSYGDSMRRQRDTAQEWCLANGYRLADRAFEDKKTSGWTGANFKEDSELKQFVKLHNEGKLEGGVLIIDSVDRFSRLPVSKSTHYFLDVVNAGIGLVFSGSYDKRIVTSELIDKEPYLLQSIIGELNRAHRESEERSRKIKEGKQGKKADMQAGIVLTHNNIPKYFTFIRSFPNSKTDKTGKYIHNEATPIIKELIEGALAGKSLYEMAADLNNRNIPTIRRKFEWSGNSISKILRNPVLHGAFLGNENYVLPIINKAKFNKLQNILTNNVFNRGKKAGLINIFKRICFCAECGKRMTVSSGIFKEVPYRYFHCSNYGKRSSCKEKAFLPLDKIEHDFFYAFLAKSPQDLITGDEKTEIKEVQDKVEEKTVSLNQITDEINRLVELIAVSPIEELKVKLPQLDKKRDDLKDEISALNGKVIMIQETPKRLDDVFLTTTLFGEGENGEDIVKYTYQETYQEIEDALKDNKARESMRVLLPSLIGKIVVSSKTRSFAVFNRRGGKVYQSRKFPSVNNNTERWRQSLKTWTTRKTAGGRVVTCKRYQRAKKA